MSNRVKREGQNIMDWLDELVASDPEAQKAYEDEALRVKLSDALHRARELAGMTQALVAEEMGVRQSMISKLERPDHNHTVETVLSYLQAVGAGLVMAVVAPNGRDLIPASSLAENAVLLSGEVIKQAEAAEMSPREYVMSCLAHHETAEKMVQAFSTELKQNMTEIRGWISFQQSRSGPVKAPRRISNFAHEAGGSSPYRLSAAA